MPAARSGSSRGGSSGRSKSGSAATEGFANEHERAGDNEANHLTDREVKAEALESAADDARQLIAQPESVASDFRSERKDVLQDAEELPVQKGMSLTKAHDASPSLNNDEAMEIEVDYEDEEGEALPDSAGAKSRARSSRSRRQPPQKHTAPVISLPVSNGRTAAVKGKAPASRDRPKAGASRSAEKDAEDGQGGSKKRSRAASARKSSSVPTSRANSRAAKAQAILELNVPERSATPELSPALEDARLEGSAIVDEEDQEQDEDGGTTRCVCGRTDDDAPGSFFIQCDICKAWQHGPCMGLDSEDACPETYYCEQCRPDLHPQLSRKASKSRSQQAGGHHRTNSHSTSKGKEKEKEREREPEIQVEAHKTRRSASSDVKHQQTVEDAPTAKISGHSRREAAASALSHSSNKRRSTMNSRDAAFEEQLAQAMRLSKAAAGIRDSSPAVTSHTDMAIEDDDDEGNAEDEQSGDLNAYTEGSAVLGTGHKRKRSGPAPSQSTKRSRSQSPSQDPPSNEERAAGSPDAEFLAPPPPRKRPVNGKAAKKGAFNKSASRDVDDEHERSSKSRQPNQYTYRSKQANGLPIHPPRARISPQKRAAMERSNRAAIGDGTQPIGRLNWAMPEYLLHLKHLLPASNPSPLAVPTFDPLRAAESEVDEAALSTVQELPTRIRYPAKRMSLPEMKKRSKNMIDYLAKVQNDMSDRNRRQQMLNRLKSTPEGSPPSSTSSNNDDQAASIANMASITRDLVQFQNAFLNRSTLASEVSYPDEQ